MRLLVRPLAAAVLTAAWLPIFPAAHAQTPPAQAPAPSPGLSNPSPNIPEQKLDAAAAAMEKVAGVQQDYQQRIAAADPAEKERLASEGTKALVKAVTDEGLSVRGVHLDSAAGAERSRGSAENTSTSRSFDQVARRSGRSWPCLSQ